MTDDLTRLKRFMAAGERSTDTVRGRVRAKLLDHMEQAPSAGVPGRARRLRLSLALLGPAGVAAAVIVLVSGVDDRRLGPAGAAARTLERAASAAAQAPAEVPAAGSWLRVRERERRLVQNLADGWRLTATVERTTWIARDGRTRVRESAPRAVRFLTPRDRERWIAAGRPPLVQPRRPPVAGSGPGFTVGQERLSYRQLLALPTAGAALHERLRRAAGSLGDSPEAETFVIIGDLLRSAPLSSRLRAALYRAASRIPGVRLARDARDPLGRRAVGVELSTGAQSFMLIFDPRTAEYLGDRTYLGRTLVSWRVVESRAVVSEAPGGDRTAP